MELTDLERQKLQAEIQKLHAETIVARRQRWTVVAEWLKASGAIAATLLALYAASATYRATQLEARLATVEKLKADQERAVSLAAKDAAVNQKIVAERELAALLIQVQTAQDRLAQLDASTQGRAVSASLRQISGNLQEASQTAEQVLPHVLIVPASQSQNDVATRFANLFRQRGLNAGVNGPVRRASDTPATVEVHFYKATEREEAERVLKLLSEVGITSGRVVLRTDRVIRRNRYYELRLPAALDLTLRGAA